LNVKLCKASDTTCANPDATGVTSTDGTVQLANVPLNNTPYLGYADVTGSSIPETLVYLPAFGSDPAQTVSIINSLELSLSGGRFGGPDTGSHGLITGSVADCARQAASGVVITVDPTDTDSASPTTVYYVSNAQPVQGATSTVASGQYVITNVPPGDAETVTATNSDGDVTGIYSVVIKAGAVTTIIGVPNQ